MNEATGVSDEATCAQLDPAAFRLAFENAGSGIAFVSAEPDKPPRYLYVNNALCALMGLSETELLTTATPLPFDVATLPPIDFSRLPLAALDSVERRHTRPDESHVWVLVSTRLVVTSPGQKNYFITQLTDITERKEQELVLAAERRRLSETEAIGAVGRWEYYPESQRVTCSRGLFTIHGLQLDEFSGNARAAFAHIAREDAGDLSAAVQACVATGNPIQVRYRITRRDNGELRWILVEGGPIYENGALDRLAGVASDITSQVNAEQQAAKASRLNDQYQALLSSIVEGVVIQDVEGCIVETNSAACEILRLDTDQLSGRTSADPRWSAIDETGAPLPGEHHPSMQALRSGQPVQNVRFGIVAGDAETRWIRASSAPLFDASGTIEGVITGFVDITAERRNAAEVAQANQERYQELVGNLPASRVFIFDRDLRVITCGGSLLGARGWTAAGLVGRSAEEFAEPAEMAIARPAFQAGLRGQASSFEMVGTRGNHLVVDVVPLEVSDGIPQRLLATVRDITDQRNAERALKDSEDRFRLAFDTAPLGMAMIDLSPDSIGQLVRVNSAMCSFMGRTATELCQLGLVSITATRTGSVGLAVTTPGVK